MRKFSNLFGLAALGLLASCASVATRPGPTVEEQAGCAWNVCVRFDDNASGRRYVVVNREPVPATILLSFRELRNLSADVEFPIERIVPPLTRGVLVDLEKVDNTLPVAATPSIFIDLGAPDTRPDIEYLYAAPFGGTEPRPVIQGFVGDDTHQLGMRYSLDIAMPEGTPVLAARGGTVLYVQDGFTQGGRDPTLFERSNLVIIAHDDLSMASYGHLSPGIPVEVGDEVREREFIGFSGSTGFTGTPHLHFHVGVRLLGDPGRTMPVRMKDRNGREFFPLEGTLIPPSRASRARAAASPASP